MEAIWQNNEIRFDCPANQLKFRKGERLIETFNNIEDSKGNPDESGTFKFTNLRALWYSDVNKYINLSIGYDTINTCENKASYSGANGTTQILTIRCKYNSSKFEFIFTSRNKESARVGSVFTQIRQMYEGTKLFRDIRMRGAIIKDKDLELLPTETIVNRYNNVWNLASETSNVGTFLITNVRIVWYHASTDNFNSSIPYVQIKSIKKKDSKSGPALVVETFPQTGEPKGYSIGFQSDKMSQILPELTKLHKLYYGNPNFGMDSISQEVEESDVSEKESIRKNIDEDAEAVDNDYGDKNNNIMNYVTSSTGNEVSTFLVKIGNINIRRS